MSLSTGILPSRHPTLAQTLDTDTPAFGAEDFRGLAFSSSVPSRYTVNSPVTLIGRVSNPSADVTEIELLFWREGGESVSFVADVNRSGDFSVPVAFAASRKKRLGSWDRMIVPLPGSRVIYLYGEPMTVPRHADLLARFVVPLLRSSRKEAHR